MPTPTDEAQRRANARRLLKKHPSLRNALQPRLTKYIPHKPFPKQAAFLCLPVLDAFYGGAAGGGKAQPLDALVCTPWGFRKMRDIHVGSIVTNPSGTISTVIQEHSQGVVSIYKVTFDDGSSTEVTADHRWKYRITRAHRTAKADGEQWKIGATETLSGLIGKEGRHVVVPLTEPVHFTVGCRYNRRPIDAYVLGALLGDGCFARTNNITFTSADKEIVNKVQKRLCGKLTPSGKYEYVIADGGALHKHIKSLGLMRLRSHEKFIPDAYKLAPIEDRWELIRGLFDTDGFASADGKADITTTSSRLAEDIRFVLQSLGARVTTKSAAGKYNGKTCKMAYTLYVQIQDKRKLFSISRKRSRCRAGFNGGHSELARRIASIEFVRRARAKCITIDHPNGLYLTNDFVVTHNSDALLMAALQYVDIPGYSALLLRRTYKELTLPGALMDRAMQWLLPTDAKWSSEKHRWTFPSGATLTFGHLQHRTDVYEYDSSEFQFIGFDEATKFEEFMFRFLFNRLRRLKGVPIPLRMRAASNPGGIGHLFFKERYIKHPGKDGRVFIPALLEDNPALDRASYEQALNNLDHVTRLQRRYGDWDANYEGTVFKREYFGRVISYNELPDNLVFCRFWDLAATEGDGDWTVGTKVGWDMDHTWYVVDVQRVQYSSGKVERLIKSTAHQDGRLCMVRLEQEPGASGKSLINRYVDILPGFDIEGIRSTGAKEVRWRPISIQAEHNNVVLVSAPWNNDWLEEICNVPNVEHDDQADSVSGAHNILADDIPDEYGVEFLKTKEQRAN